VQDEEGKSSSVSDYMGKRKDITWSAVDTCLLELRDLAVCSFLSCSVCHPYSSE